MENKKSCIKSSKDRNDSICSEESDSISEAEPEDFSIINPDSTKDADSSHTEERIKEDKKINKKSKLIANIQYTEYDVVKEVLKERFNCKLRNSEGYDFDIIWVDTGVNSAMVSKLKPYQKVNHYHGMYCLARKNYLGRNLMKLKRALPNDYNYFPPTWLLPTDWNEFKAQFINGNRNDTYILKPEALSQGQGIFLTNTFEGIDLEQKYVAQKYISKPYLIDGLKFDLRIYVLVYGCDPLRVFLFREGLTRLATEPYIPPTTQNIDDLYVHLTNYAINKNNSNFVFNTDPDKTDVGHKRNLSFVWKYVDNHGGDSTKLREEIKDCIVKTLCAVQPLLKHSYRSCQAYDNQNNKCFEILGFDILLDQDLKPWLLEVNHSPSFTTDTPFDRKIKAELLTDVLNIVKLDPNERIKYYKELEEKKSKFFAKKEKIQKQSKEEILEIRKKEMEIRDKYELEHCGGFSRIYPEITEGESKYEKYIKTAQTIWDQFTGTKKSTEVVIKKTETINKKQKPKKTEPIVYKNKYPVPINRKPLYYIKPVPKCKPPEESFSEDEGIIEVLKDDTLRSYVIQKLRGESLNQCKENPDLGKAIDYICAKLINKYKDPIEIIESYFNNKAEEVN